MRYAAIDWTDDETHGSIAVCEDYKLIGSAFWHSSQDLLAEKMLVMNSIRAIPPRSALVLRDPLPPVDMILIGRGFGIRSGLWLGHLQNVFIPVPGPMGRPQLVPIRPRLAVEYPDEQKLQWDFVLTGPPKYVPTAESIPSLELLAWLVGSGGEEAAGLRLCAKTVESRAQAEIRTGQPTGNERKN